MASSCTEIFLKTRLCIFDILIFFYNKYGIPYLYTLIYNVRKLCLENVNLVGMLILFFEILTSYFMVVKCMQILIVLNLGREKAITHQVEYNMLIK